MTALKSTIKSERICVRSKTGNLKELAVFLLKATVDMSNELRYENKNWYHDFVTMTCQQKA